MSPVATTIQLPIFDVSDTSLENGKRLVSAAIDYGFLFVSPDGTPLTEDLVGSQFNLSKEFFACPTSEKQKYHVGTDNRGWLGMHNEILDPAHQTKEFKEAFNMGEFKNGQPQQKMPPILSTEKSMQQLVAFEDACKTTCNMILDLIGQGLEIEDGKDWFSKRHGQPSGCVVRFLHYPTLPAVSLGRTRPDLLLLPLHKKKRGESLQLTTPQDAEYSPDTDVRAGAHSDYGSITLLFQRPSQPGLEIRPDPNSDSWAPVPVFPPNYPSSTFPPILVNIGDLMSYWTSGLLRSTVHRVIFPKDTKASEDRYTVAYFCHPSDDEELVAVPSPVVRDHREAMLKQGKQVDEFYGYGGGAAGRRALTAREHLMKRLGATYSHRVDRSNE